MIGVQEFFSFVDNGIDVRELIITVILALLAGIIIYFTNRVIHARVTESDIKCAELVIMPVMSAIAVLSIRSIIAVAIVAAIIVVGFFVRFTKGEYDNKENLSLMWGVAAGVCLGEEQYIAAGVMCIVIFLILWIFDCIRDDSKWLLVVSGAQAREVEAGGIVYRTFKDKAILRDKISDLDGFKMTFEISDKVVRRVENHNTSVTERIKRIDGITSAELIRKSDKDRDEE